MVIKKREVGRVVVQNKKPEFTYNDIHSTVVEYHWMVNELERLKAQLNTVESVGVASYSDEPMGGSAGPSQRIETEVIRRGKKWERMKRYEKRIAFINNQSCITDERERVVLDCLLDGMTMRKIGLHMKVSQQTVVNLRNGMLTKIYESQL